MSTLKQKLEYINETKKQIGDAIKSKGGSVTDNFREYATAITNLPSGGGGGTSEVMTNQEIINLFKTIGYDESDVPFEITNKFKTKEEFDKLKSDVAYSKTLYDAWDNKPYNKYKGNTNLVYSPKFIFNDTAQKNAESMFSGCTNLIYVPSIYFKGCTHFGWLFEDCTNLLYVGNIKFDNYKFLTGPRTASLFLNCSNLKKAPFIDFLNMSQLGPKNIKPTGTSGTLSIRFIFAGCSSLEECYAPNVTPNNIIGNNNELISLNYINYSGCFKGCTNLKRLIGVFYFNKSVAFDDLRSFYNNFLDCINLEEVYIYGYNNATSESWIDFRNCPKLSVESIMFLINNANTASTSKGSGPTTIYLGPTNIAKLTADQIKVATDKGWKLA